MGSAENVAKANHLVAEAKSVATASSNKFLSLFVKSSSSNLDKAAELYKSAYNLYRLENMHREAGDCLYEAARLMKQAHSGGYAFQAASEYANAFNAYKTLVVPRPTANSPPLVPGSKEFAEIVDKAVSALTHAIDIYVSSGKFDNAAKQKISLAELYEQVLKDNSKAIKAYQEAADWLSGENSRSRANTAYLKVAYLNSFDTRLIAGQNGYIVAAEIYERVGIVYSEERLLRHSAKDHFFRSVLCHLANKADTVTATKKLREFQSISPLFADSRESKFLISLLDAIEQDDEPGFTGAVTNFDKLSRMDEWLARILVHVKRASNISDDAANSSSPQSNPLRSPAAPLPPRPSSTPACNTTAVPPQVPSRPAPPPYHASASARSSTSHLSADGKATEAARAEVYDDLL